MGVLSQALVRGLVFALLPVAGAVAFFALAPKIGNTHLVAGRRGIGDLVSARTHSGAARDSLLYRHVRRLV
jgi:hypothetical protein